MACWYNYILLAKTGEYLRLEFLFPIRKMDIHWWGGGTKGNNAQPQAKLSGYFCLLLTETSNTTLPSFLSTQQHQGWGSHSINCRQHRNLVAQRESAINVTPSPPAGPENHPLGFCSLLWLLHPLNVYFRPWMWELKGWSLSLKTHVCALSN